jgi:hypothetical protein
LQHLILHLRALQRQTDEDESRATPNEHDGQQPRADAEAENIANGDFLPRRDKRRNAGEKDSTH